jgi:hypothetical protein
MNRWSQTPQLMFGQWQEMVIGPSVQGRHIQSVTGLSRAEGHLIASSNQWPFYHDVNIRKELMQAFTCASRLNPHSTSGTTVQQ